MKMKNGGMDIMTFTNANLKNFDIIKILLQSMYNILEGIFYY